MAPPLVGQHPVGDPEQPRELSVWRYVVKAPPGHGEDLGDEVVDIGGSATAARVGLQRLVAGVEKPAEALDPLVHDETLTLRLRAWFPDDAAYEPAMKTWTRPFATVSVVRRSVCFEDWR